MAGQTNHNNSSLYILYIVILFLSFLSLSNVAVALVYWPTDYGDYGSATFDKPAQECMARVNAAEDRKRTAVIIAPDFILTARHLGDFTDNPPRRISVATETDDKYVLVDRRVIEDHAIWPYGTTDVAIYKVKVYEADKTYEEMADANFSTWVNLYTVKDPNMATINTDFDELGRSIALGSYGPIRTKDPSSGVLTQQVPAGTLHWGRNVISPRPTTLIDPNVGTGLDIDFNEPGDGDYLKFEVYADSGDSGSTWFIKDIEWGVASDFTYVMSGFRISTFVSQIDAAIESMGGTRPLPPLADIFWIGGDEDDWHDANNWDPNAIPTLTDKAAIDNNSVAVISGGETSAKELWVGINTGGSLYQTGGTLTTEYMYVGGRADCNTSSYTLDGGSFSTHDLVIGRKGPGVLDINDCNSPIVVSNLLLGTKGVLIAGPNSVIHVVASDDQSSYQVDGRFDIDKHASAADLAALGNLTVVCGFEDEGYDPNVVVAIEAPERENEVVGWWDFCTENFVLDKLIIGYDVNDISETDGRVSIKIVDDRRNQDGQAPEALYVNTLGLKAGATICTDPCTGDTHFPLYYKSGWGCVRFLMGDVNLDGCVNQSDLDIWAANEDATGAQWSMGDVNGDRTVDQADKAIIERAAKCAKNPYPKNRSTITETTPLLAISWDAGMDANSHNVYFGTSFADVNDANESCEEFLGNQTQNSLELASLPADQTYYWRIDEVDASDNATRGYVWSFTYRPLRVRNVSTGEYFCHIQQAVDAADNNDIIVAGQDTYYECIDFKGKTLTLRSDNPDSPEVVSKTVIDAGGAYAAVTFQTAEGENAVISGFAIRNATAGIHCSGARTKPLIEKCHIFANDFGVYIYSGSSSTVVGNRIFGNRDTGICCAYAGATVLQNNLIYANINEVPWYGSGIGISSTAEVVTVANNTIVNNSWGLYAASSTEPNITNCILWINAYDDLWVDGGPLGAPYSCIEDANFIDDPNITHNICRDPSFVDADANNFHLTADSPCVNAGDPNGVYDAQEDIDSETRVACGRVDIGADEYYMSLADIDDSQLVDLLDYATLANTWTLSPSDPNWNEACDLNDDDLIDCDDLALFCADWLWQPAWAEPIEYMMMGAQGEGMMMEMEAAALESAAIDPDTAAEVIKYLDDAWQSNQLPESVTEETYLDLRQAIENVAE